MSETAIYRLYLHVMSYGKCSIAVNKRMVYTLSTDMGQNKMGYICTGGCII